MACLPQTLLLPTRAPSRAHARARGLPLPGGMAGLRLGPPSPLPGPWRTALAPAPPRQARPLAPLAASAAPFEFATASRIVFGAGTFAQAPGIVEEMLAGAAGSGILVVTGKSDRFSLRLEAMLADHGVTAPVSVFHVEGEPDADTIVAAIAAAKGCGCVVAVGGGSAIDTAKAVAALLTNGGENPDPYDFLEVVGRGKTITIPSAPFLAIPTTAGPGAEVTRNAVIGAGDRKVSIRSPHMLPQVALVDPELTLSLPPGPTASTGLDALIQCIEPFVSNKANPVTDALALQGMSCGARHLRAAVADTAGVDVEAREGMCVCSLLGGLALANSKLGAVHGFAGVIGGMYAGAAHGAVCAALLVPATRANLAALEAAHAGGDAGAGDSLERYVQVARALTGDPGATAAGGLAWMEALVADLAVPGLGSYGLGEEAVADVCHKSAAASSMQGNPVKLSTEQLEGVLRAAL